MLKHITYSRMKVYIWRKAGKYYVNGCIFWRHHFDGEMRLFWAYTFMKIVLPIHKARLIKSKTQ